MKTELEAKWLNVDHEDLRKKLNAAGATREHPERFMARKVFDYEDKRLARVGGWVRVRQEGDKTTLSYKQLNDRTVHGTKEITVVVNDFAATCSFLESIGLIAKSYQETKRESWKLDDVEIELDTWPWIPGLVELEASHEDTLKSVAQKLDLDYRYALHGSVETAYQAVYDVTEEEVDNWKEITFSEIPKWLLAAKK